MPRRKKALDVEGDENAKRPSRKTKRVNLSVRVAQPARAPRQASQAEDDQAAVEQNDAVNLSPEVAEGVAQEIEHLKLERDKKVLMWIGVTFIMAVVLVFWVYNLKIMFKEQASRDLVGQQMNLEEISDQFNKTIEEVSDGLSKLNDISTTTLGLVETPTTTPATSTDLTATSGLNIEETEEIRQLKARLEELERRFNLSTSTTKITN